MRVVITEKPSVARDLARVLGARGKHEGYLEGDDLRIGWCFGHMAELEDPAHYNPEWKAWSPETLPMLPEDFALRVRKGAKDQVAVLLRLLRDKSTTAIVNACDAGREGELIFRYLLQLAGVGAPVNRLWVSSMTDQAISAAWKRMRAGAEYDTLADAARCRAEADWLVGLNGTRAMTCLARSAGGAQLLSVGRVQTPTLAMIVSRDLEIEAFEPEDYWQVRAVFAPEGIDDEEQRFEATWFRKVDGDSDKDDDDSPAGPSTATRLPTQEAAAQLVAAVGGGQGKVVKAERKRVKDRPPLLYDLTSLQRRANQRYGFSAQQTLDIAQALYERHKLITYPRTDARFLTDDQVGELPGVVEAVGRVPVYSPFAKGILASPIRPGRRVVDAAEVGDHHAILPTDRSATGMALSPDEKRIYDLVARRLLAVLMPDALFDTARIEVAMESPQGPLPESVEAPLLFRARGRMCVDRGWQAADPPKKRKDTTLPVVEVGDALDAREASHKKGTTRPPPHHNDASLLKSMETAGRELDDKDLRRAMRQAGLGTPATRASILETLQRRGFIERRGKHLHATERGRSLVKAVPVDELKSALLTGQWEARLSAMADGEESRPAFMEDVRSHTASIVEAILAAPPPPAEVLEDDREVLGTCPICETPVKEGRGAYSCAKGRACTFVIFKTVAKRKISKRSAKQLLTDGRTPVMKNFKSRKGKSFEAALVLDDEGKVTFDFPPREPRPGPAQGEAAADTAANPVGMPCPRCNDGVVIQGRTGWGCGRWREGCDWRRIP